MSKARVAAVAVALFALSVIGLSAALAEPGPGNSNQCAPGQHAGSTKPGSCDNK